MPLRRLPLGNTGDGIGVDELAENGDTACIDGDEEPQLPRDDLGKEPIGAQALAHGVGEAGQFDPVRSHDACPPELETFCEIENGPAFQQGGMRLFRREAGAAGRPGIGGPAGETRRPMIRSPSSV